MKKVIRIILALCFVVIASGVIYYNYQPFAESYINAEDGVGDSNTHMANIATFMRHHSFPIKAWQSEYFAGYPMVEGYPWLHYYLIQPVLSFFRTPGIAMDYYSVAFLFVFYITCFLLLYYSSRNAFLALLFSLVIVYGADSGMFLYVNSFMIFVASQFLLPLTLLLVIIARERNKNRLLLFSSLLLAISFYAHGSMTGIIIIPMIFPFLIFDIKGKITKESFAKTFKYFSIFALLSSIQIYQFLSYSFQGQDVSSVKPHPLNDIPARYAYMFSWQNPVLLPLLILLIPLFIIAARKSFSRLKPYLFSFISILFIFSLMVFKITGLVVILLAERALWGVSLGLLLLLAAVVRELVNSGVKKSIFVGLTSIFLTAVYLYFTLIIGHSSLVPDISRPMDPYSYLTYEADDDGKMIEDDGQKKYENKYDRAYDYPPLSWNQSFDNYRTDGISYNIYSSWAISSSNPRYKARYPAMKGLPLHWSGLVSGAEYGMLGEAAAFDNSQWALNQSIFFFDWYAIKHFEIRDVDTDLADFLRTEPYIVNTEKSKNIVYHSLDKKYVGPIYAPTNAKTMAVIAPEQQYDNFIRTLSYSIFKSDKLIPIYLGSSLGSLKKDDLKYYDSIFLYGYKKPILSKSWEMLYEYVTNGGNLIIETGQKVSETGSLNLPEVFPIQSTKMSVVSEPWNVGVKENDLTEGVDMADFSPLKTKYLPYSISEAKQESLNNWAKPVLLKDDSVVMAFGKLGGGNVVWSGINLPFHAIDNRNISETVIFANILEWFFPEIDEPIENYTVSVPGYEKIIINGSQGKGVLIKEHYNPGWSATINGKRAKIYKAGLFLMYVPLSSNQGEYVVELSYNGAPIHWILFIITTITFVGLVIYLLLNKNPLFFVTKIYLTRTKDDEIDY